jgi:hypothetical protein
MKFSTPNFIRWYPILSLVLACTVLGSCIVTYNYFKVDDRIPVSIIGVQHLGSDYLIDRFYINKSGGGNVGEGGGGGGMVCCLTLPKKWNPALKADVRWEVHHIIRTASPTTPDTAEVEGIYHAQVPVEPYAKPDDFYVHFFPNGRVRIVVSSVASDGEQHPIRWGDSQASRTATAGTAVREIFTAKELVEIQREIDLKRKKYGDWR